MRKELALGGLHTSLAENRTPDGRAFAISNATVDDKTFKCDRRYANIGSRPTPNAADVCYGLGYGKFGCNETQTLTITGAPTSGTVIITVTLGGVAADTAAIPYNASAKDINDILVALTSIEDGEVVVSGGPWPLEAVNVTFKGRYRNATQTLIALKTNALGGGSTPTLAIARLVTGGDHEEYLVPIKKSGDSTATLYSVTSSDGFATTTWTSVATGLTASDWFFEQFSDRIYACNSTDGILYKQLGGSWSGKVGITSVQNPATPPSGIPVVTDANPYDFTGATFGSLSSTVSAVVLEGTNRQIKITLNGALAGDVVSFQIILGGASDWSHQDYIATAQDTTTSEIVLDESQTTITLVNNDGSPATLTPPFLSSGKRFDGGTTSTFGRNFHWGSKDRTLRDNILKINVSMLVAQGTTGKFIHFRLYRQDTWTNDRMATLDMSSGPVNQAVEYAYSYLKASTLSESKLSPSAFTSKIPGYDTLGNYYYGAHVRVTCTGSSQLTTADYIKVYRKDRFGLFRYVGSMANVTSGTTTFTDNNMLDELENYPIAPMITLPNGYLPEFLTKWKGCLAVASDRKLWLSYVGNPLIYAPDPDLFALQSTLDTTDPDIPRTAFVSDSRSENIIGLVGQDSIYLSGPSTGFAMTSGDKPMQLSPARPMPGSRGCMSYRGACRLSGGALFPYRDGLWYYSVSAGFAGLVQSGTIIEEEITKEIRTTWSGIFGGSPSGAVVTVFDDEIYCFSATRYIRRTRNGHWISGTMGDSLKAAFANQINGLIFATSTGKLMRFDDVATDAGTAVSFSYTTGKIEGERTRIKTLQVFYTGRPAVLLECWDGSGGYAYQRFDMEPIDANGNPTVNYDPAGILIQGYRYRITLYGTGADVIESVAVYFDGAQKGGAGN